MGGKRVGFQVETALEQRVAQLALINRVAAGIVASLQLSEVLENREDDPIRKK